MGIKTDVINIGRILTKEHSRLSSNDQNLIDKLSFNNDIPINTKKYRPIQGGCVIGYKGNNGTLGCIVTKIIDNKKEYYILSNNHVIADDNKAPIGSSILQPSLDYGGIPFFNSAAYLEDYFPTISIEENDKAINYVDCAIAKVKNKNLISNEVIGIGKITGKGIAYPGLFVQKYGFVSGLTTGVIKSVNTTVPVGEDSEKSLYKRQLNINIKGRAGDSGSAIVNEYGEVVGLLMAGTTKGSIIANEISRVLDALNIEIYTGN